MNSRFGLRKLMLVAALIFLSPTRGLGFGYLGEANLPVNNLEALFRGAGSVSFSIDNDYKFGPLQCFAPSSTDRYYSNGLQIALLVRPTDKYPWMNRLLDRGQAFLEFGHNMYSPSSANGFATRVCSTATDSGCLDAAERPYAGWAYWGAGFYRVSGTLNPGNNNVEGLVRYLAAGFRIGRKGIESLAVPIQKQWHDLKNQLEGEALDAAYRDQHPNWERRGIQVDGGTAVNFSGEYGLRYDPSNARFRFIPGCRAFGNFGTMFNNAGIGVSTRLEFGSRARRAMIQAIVGLTGMYAFTNETIDGDLDVSGYGGGETQLKLNPDRKKAMISITYGFNAKIPFATLAFLVDVRSPETEHQKTQDPKWHAIKKITLTFDFRRL